MPENTQALLSDQPPGGPAEPEGLSAWELDKVRRMNEAEGKLTGYDCPVCHNKGLIYLSMDTVRECECMTVRRGLTRASKSSLSRDMLARYTFSRYSVTAEWQQKTKAKAMTYAKSPAGWFYIGGQPGADKTHLCVAIMNRLLKVGWSGRYMEWRSSAQVLKAVMNTPEYVRLMEQYQKAPLLYIDDLFKVQNGCMIPPGDLNLAIDLLYSRYNHPDRLTIISSEWTLQQLMDIDEGIASRVKELAGKNVLSILKDRDKNYRMQEVE